MRIPLDYYQILGIPESNLSELEQAYQDRLLQLPRKEYSDAAIESRKRLITAAYEVLSDPPQRERAAAAQRSTVGAVDADDAGSVSQSFLRRHELDIPAEQFLGGLLILFELGEYEEINTICMPYLGNNGRSNNSGSLYSHHPSEITPSGNLRSDGTSSESMPLAGVKQAANGATSIVPLRPDIILTMVSSFLELGEREWRDGCYEEAVVHYETAKNILVQEDLFPQIQGDIERRLDRLRPYRIQSLVSLPLECHDRRRHGIQFLEELLESACTNEIKCQERFGLNSDTTISFIHNTLRHLTAAEQRNLFSHVARDSQQVNTNSLNVMQLVCTYLHVHALIAQGFAYRNPQSIYTAQQILLYRVGRRLDVTVEQAICALLLGQTDEANRILTNAPASAALLVIEQQSQGQPDLLRGLCFHTESWFKNESFPCFRDLVEADPSIENYFNDRDVQDFVMRLPVAEQVTDWDKTKPELIEVPPSGDLSGTLPPSGVVTPASASSVRGIANGHRPPQSNNFHPPTRDRIGMGQISPAVRVEVAPPPTSTSAGGSSEGLYSGELERVGGYDRVESVAERNHQAIDLERERNHNAIELERERNHNVIELESERQRRRSGPVARTIDGKFEQIYPVDGSPADLATATASQMVPVQAGKLARRSSGTIVRPPRRRRRKPNIPRIILVGAGGATCIWGAAWLTGAAFNAIGNLASPPKATRPTPTPTLVQQPKPKSTSPQPTSGQAIAVGLLSMDGAQQVIGKWLGAKAKSLSKDYQTDGLQQVLAEPALSQRLELVKDNQAEGVHWQYSHPQIAIESIQQATPVADTAKVRARVTEDAKKFQGDRPIEQGSYSRQLVVQYDLIRQGNGWYIKNMDLVK